MAIKLKIQDNTTRLKFRQDEGIKMSASDVIPLYENDYENLRNKPSINGVTLSGDKTTEDLGIEAGVTSWNGQTGDVVYTPPNYALTYDESVSVGSAVVGEAVTGEPNYTPSGTVTGTINGAISQRVTKDTVTMMYNGWVSLNANYSNYVLTLSTSFNPSTVNKTIVTNVTAPTFNGTGDFTFNGTGVTFVIEQEN